MVLLDENTMEPLHPLFLILLSETFIIARPSGASSRLRFQLSSTHRLENVAIVNVKRPPTEQPYAELIIQLIIFPEQLYIKCESARVKRQWLDGIENAKRLLEHEKSLHRQATIRGILLLVIQNDQKQNKEPAKVFISIHGVENFSIIVKKSC
jgi:hypothetical protein